MSPNESAPPNPSNQEDNVVKHTSPVEDVQSDVSEREREIK